MTIRRDNDMILLQDVCAVEDAELLMQEVQAGATGLDWSGCTHLHTACLQVMMASRLPIRGNAASSEIQRWVAPFLAAGTAVAAPPDIVSPPAAQKS